MAGNIIDLTEIPDCDTCSDPTKEVRGATIDFEGPGMTGRTYDCKNTKCRGIRNLKLLFLWRSIRHEIR